MKVLSLLVMLLGGAAAGIQEFRIESVFAHLATRKTPGAALLVRKDGKTIIQRGYGVRDLRRFVPVDKNTNFRLASLTKQFTATAVMLLVRDGKLHYDEPLTQIFPDFPGYGRSITVRHLLGHTSGLPDYEDLMDGGPWTESLQIQDDEVLTLLKQRTNPKFAAGTSWSYSNSGYVVLGLIVQKVSGSSFGDFLRQRVFEPLHMNHTLVFAKGRNSVPNRAFGHTKHADSFLETDQSATSATQGDGGVYSNLEDLAKWDESLERHTLLSESEMQAALRPALLDDGSGTRWPLVPGNDNLNPGAPVAYGFGWFLDPYATRARMWHFGSTRGFSTAIERFTGEKLTVVVLCNRSDMNANDLAIGVANVFW